MCGLVSIFSQNHFNLSLQTTESMLKKISHRGPDGEGILKPDDYSIFGHVRLSILDIEHGSQPMVSDNGRYILVFNGEIYNFVELRQTLIKKGHTFRGYGDTEILLHLLIEEGENCLKKLNGMFSFVFYDKFNYRWIAARDHFGIKPLYWANMKDGGIAFASEIKSLLCHPSIKKELCQTGLHDYLTFQLVLEEGTLFRGIYKIQPGHFAIGFSNENNPPKIKEWWRLKFDIDESHNKSWFNDKLMSYFLNSIQLQTRSDVPLGCYLSGGIDSSIVSAFSSEHLGEGIPCFHGKFLDYPGFDESIYASEVAKEFNLELHQKAPTKNEFIDFLPKIIKSMDEPVAGPGVFPQYMVSKLASEHVKVVLGGQGGDELFCGYSRYLIAYLEQALKGAINETQEEGNHLLSLSSIVPNLPTIKGYESLIRKFWADGVFGPMNKRYFNLISRMNIKDNPFTNDLMDSFDQLSQYSRFDKIFNSSDSASYINKMTYFDLKTLLPALLQVEDRVSMAWGLEARVPILDFRIAELAATIPPVQKFKGGETKAILKGLSANILPKKVINRKDKMGFPVPLSHWIKDGVVKEFIFDLLLSECSLQRGIFRKEYLKNLLESSKGPASRELWGAISLELWFRSYID